VVPGFDEIKKRACAMAQRIPSLRLNSFDLTLVPDGGIVCLEVNCVGQGLEPLQISGGGVFGQYTEEVVRYCAAHRNKDQFQVFRLFA